MTKTSKRTKAISELINPDNDYSVGKAVELVKRSSTAKFDETVELHVKTALDGQNQDQQLRGSISLPHGTGREVRVAVFAEGEAATLAREAGADHVGGDELVASVRDGMLDFNVAIAQRELMGKVGSLGRVLGPRGLMPNPRTNTVLSGEDIPKAIEEVKAGRIDFRLDRNNGVHAVIGKASFDEIALEENLRALISEMERNRPSGAKGELIRGASISSTMGRGVRLDLQDLKDAV
ncbi:MAG: 50S ribosomal protein L1 [Dehalococcoidia bacterium]|nr:50S ribosomal protein L1 [Dehalococcoidia bacterium]